MRTQAEIIELMAAMAEHGVDELSIKEGEDSLKLRRHVEARLPLMSLPTQTVPYEVLAANDKPQVLSSAPTVTGQESKQLAPAPADPPQKEGEDITAPVVGVYYAAASPEAAPFVQVGQEVKAGDVLCIIEAMKLMNEVTAEKAGKIAEIYVHNGDRIEYGQALMRLV